MSRLPHLLACVSSIATLACGSRPAPEVSSPATAEIAPPRRSLAAQPAPAAPEFVVTNDRELLTPKPISFRVRPLAGPGSMGPSEIAPESADALEHVVSYLRAHPAEEIRIECAVSALKMSSGPNVGRGTHLAQLVARALIERGVACQRLQPAGILVRSAEAPAEKVRFMIGRDPLQTADADPCGAP